MILWSLIVLIIIALDQISKYWVVNNIGLTDSFVVIPKVIDFVYVKNTGAAFSFLSETTYGIIFLSCISVIFCVGVIWFMIKKKPQHKLLTISLALMLSGAIGNVIDRIFRGAVVDFFEIRLFKFAIFNVADIFVTVGAVLLFVYILFLAEEKDKKL